MRGGESSANLGRNSATFSRSGEEPRKAEYPLWLFILIHQYIRKSSTQKNAKLDGLMLGLFRGNWHLTSLLTTPWGPPCMARTSSISCCISVGNERAFPHLQMASLRGAAAAFEARQGQGGRSGPSQRSERRYKGTAEVAGNECRGAYRSTRLL